LALAETSSAILSQQWDPAMGYLYTELKYAKDHFRQSLLVKDTAGANRDLSYRAMVYTQLAVGWLTNNEFEEAIVLAKTGRAMLEKTDEYKNDTC
jgi:hypothetical protein